MWFLGLSASQIATLGKKRGSKKRKVGDGAGGSSEQEGRAASPARGAAETGHVSPVWAPTAKEKPASARPVETVDVGDEVDLFVPSWSITRGDALCSRTGDRRVGREAVVGLGSLPRDVDYMSGTSHADTLETLCNWMARVRYVLLLLFFIIFFYKLPNFAGDWVPGPCG